MYTANERHEIHCGKRYLDYTENEQFRAFRDRENPLSYESNYAVLKSTAEEQDTFSQVEMFFAGMDETPPKFRWRPDAVPLDRALALFERHGYGVAKDYLAFMRLTEAAESGLRLADCRVAVAEQTLTEEQRALVIASYNGNPWGLPLVTKQIAHGARGYFACNKAGVPVSWCLGEGYGEAFSISDVYTPPPCRGQGCAARVLSAALEDAERTGYTDIFLYADESGAARRLYERLGFTAEPRTVYWAVKGGVPSWMQHEESITGKELN